MAESELPKVDDWMSDDDLTAAADRLKEAVDWSRFPKLAAMFEHRPSENRYWHELVALTLISLERHAQFIAERNHSERR